MLLSALLAALGACDDSIDRSLPVAIPLHFEDGLLYAYGEALPVQDGRCTASPGEPPPPASSPRVLLDLGTPITVLSDDMGRPAQPFRHGQIQINATQPDGNPGPGRFLLCDMPIVRGNQATGEFRLDTQIPPGGLVSSGPLAAVLGSDMFGRYALSFQFADTGGKLGANLTIGRSDITPSCFIDDAVLPFVPLGGSDFLVEVGDSILNYPQTRITVGACVEPLADPFAYRPTAATVKSCIPDTSQLTFELCSQFYSDPATFGDRIDAMHLRDPAYEENGANMRFLLSTAVPELLLSETACRKLANGDTRCSCADADKVTLRLPGLNGPQPPDNGVSIERGCRVPIGTPGRAGLVFVSQQLFLSPCAELARSRRQRFALPRVQNYDGPSPDPCVQEACLLNLSRSSSLTYDRCAYSGMLVGRACDDHQAPTASYVEIGGPPDDPALPEDTILAVVVPDSARILQSVNTDIRNLTAQVDGVIGVSLLTRLQLKVDYPQNRMTMTCRCGDYPQKVCHTYRGASYYDADNCVPSNDYKIPVNYGRTICR